MDGGIGTQHLAEQTRDREFRQHDLAEEEAEAEMEAKREVGANCEELK